MFFVVVKTEDISQDMIDLGGVPCTTSDVQFQAVTSVAESHWIIPQTLESIVTNVYWSLQEGVFGTVKGFKSHFNHYSLHRYFEKAL